MGVSEYKVDLHEDWNLTNSLLSPVHMSKYSWNLTLAGCSSPSPFGSSGQSGGNVLVLRRKVGRLI
jgi:hypothetical protein